MSHPPLGLTTKVELVQVKDGDTVSLKVSREVEVRITDAQGVYDTPETYHPSNATEKRLGKLATEHLKQLLAEGELVLHIPADEQEQLKDIMTLGRVVGRLYVNGQDVAELMKAAGHQKDKKKWESRSE